MDFRKCAIALGVLALAGCGGGGGGSTDSNGGINVGGGVNAMRSDATELAAFVGDVKSLRMYATDVLGATVASPTIDWSSSATAVATAAASGVASVGSITAIGAGPANIVAKSGTVTVTTPITVHPKPTTVEDLKKVFPFKQPGSGTVATFSDVDAAGNTERFQHMGAFWTYMRGASSLLSTGPASAEFFFTRDTNVLANGRVLCGVAAPTTPYAPGSILSCPDGATDKERWYYVAPSNPLSQDKAQMQHELAEAFFERSVANERTFAWLYKGMTLYHEAGTFDASGAFGVTVASFKARLAADPTNNRVPAISASTLMNAPYEGTDPSTVIHAYSYAPGAFVLFLQTQAPYTTALRTVLPLMADAAYTNAQAIARVLQVAGRTEAQLNQDYAKFLTDNALQ